MPARIASAVLSRVPALFQLSNLFTHLCETEFGVDVQTLKPLLADGARLFLRLQVGKLLHVSISAQHQPFPAGPALQCLLLQLQGIADTPGKKRTDGENDE